MRSIFMIFVLFALISGCKEQVTEEQKTTPDEAFYKALVEQEQKYLENFETRDFERTAGELRGDTNFTRQILLVQNYELITANLRDSWAKPTPLSRCEIRLYGIASPSSNPLLKTAYLHFVPRTEKLYLPTYDSASGRMRLYYYNDQLEMILRQLQSDQNTFCWIGKFANGHLYADVHSRPK